MSAMGNPFSTVDLEISKEFRERMDDLQALHERRKPFRRQIDVWWAAMCIGLREGQRKPLESERVKFNTGAIFDSDPWRIAHLQLIELSINGDSFMEEDNWASQTIGAASEYANYGMSWLFDVVSGAPDPTLAVYKRLDEVLG